MGGGGGMREENTEHGIRLEWEGVGAGRKGTEYIEYVWIRKGRVGAGLKGTENMERLE